MSRQRAARLAMLLCLASRMTGAAQPSVVAPAREFEHFRPVTDAMLAAPDPGDWLMWRRTLDSWGFSPLKRINRSNVGKVLWEVNLGAPVTGYPITFESGGKQYVVATTGTSISTTSWNTLTPEVNTGATNMIYVFVLE